MSGPIVRQYGVVMYVTRPRQSDGYMQLVKETFMIHAYDARDAVRQAIIEERGLHGKKSKADVVGVAPLGYQARYA